MTIEEQLAKFDEDLARQDAIEERDVRLALGTILNTTHGRQIFKYLFKSFDVKEISEFGLKGEDLHERLGFLRAGNSIYKLICAADYKIASELMAEIERKKYDDSFNRYRIEQGYNAAESDE